MHDTQINKRGSPRTHKKLIHTRTKNKWNNIAALNCLFGNKFDVMEYEYDILTSSKIWGAMTPPTRAQNTHEPIPNALL